MKYLAKLTGEAHYWEAAEKVMQVVDDNGMKDGLLPIFIYADQGTFRGENIRLGSRGDSYYGESVQSYLNDLTANTPRIPNKAISPNLPPRANLRLHVVRRPRRHPQTPPRLHLSLIHI